MECPQFTNVLTTLNNSILENLTEIKENAINAYADDDGADIFDNESNLNQSAIPNQMFGGGQTMSKLERENKARSELNNMLQQLTVCSETIGFVNPMNKVYAVTLKLQSMPGFFAVFTLAILQQYLRYEPKVCCLMRKNSTTEFPIDGAHFITGLLTIFK